MSWKYPRAEEQEPEWPEYHRPFEKPIETPKAPKTPNPSKKPDEDEDEKRSMKKMGKIIPLQALRDYVDVTGKVTFDFVPKGNTANFDGHLEAAEWLREEAAKLKDKAEKNWTEFLKCNRKVNWLDHFTLPTIIGIGLAVAAVLVIIFKRDVTDTVAALALSRNTEIKMTLLYLAIAALTGFVCACIAHTILSDEKDRAEKEANENLFLAEVHREHATANEMLAAEHVRKAFEGDD